VENSFSTIKHPKIGRRCAPGRTALRSAAPLPNLFQFFYSTLGIRINRLRGSVVNDVTRWDYCRERGPERHFGFISTNLFNFFFFSLSEGERRLIVLAFVHETGGISKGASFCGTSRNKYLIGEISLF